MFLIFSDIISFSNSTFLNSGPPITKSSYPFNLGSLKAWIRKFMFLSLLNLKRLPTNIADSFLSPVSCLKNLHRIHFLKL